MVKKLIEDLAEDRHQHALPQDLDCGGVVSGVNPDSVQAFDFLLTQ